LHSCLVGDRVQAGVSWRLTGCVVVRYGVGSAELAGEDGIVSSRGCMGGWRLGRQMPLVASSNVEVVLPWCEGRCCNSGFDTSVLLLVRSQKLQLSCLLRKACALDM